MKIEINIDDNSATIKIMLSKVKSKYEDRIEIDSYSARKELIKQHPNLKITTKPEHLYTIDNCTDKLYGEWKFQIIKEEKKPLKSQKSVLTFKHKDAKVEETTQPDPEAKGVEEPTE